MMRYWYDHKKIDVTDAICNSKELFRIRFGYHPKTVIVNEDEFDVNMKSICGLDVELDAAIQPHHFDMLPVAIKRSPKVLEMKRRPA